MGHQDDGVQASDRRAKVEERPPLGQPGGKRVANWSSTVGEQASTPQLHDRPKEHGYGTGRSRR